MFEAIFWMGVGAALFGTAQHFYNNKKFREALREEREKAERKIQAVKRGWNSN